MHYLSLSGQIKPAILKMAQMAADAHEHQVSYGKFSRMLTAPMPPPNHRRVRN